MDACKGIVPLQVRARLGNEAYAAVRERILEHMEVFVENIYDLHRLTRRQHHLESICEDKDAYAAELHRLVSPEAPREDDARAAGAAEKAEEVGTCHLARTPTFTNGVLCKDGACVAFYLLLQ